MDKATVEEGLARKNARAVLVSVEHLSTKLHEMAEKVNALNTALATLQQRLTDVERDLAIARISRMGTGPTVRDG